MEDELPHSASVVEVGHLVGDVLGVALAEPLAWGEPVKGRDAAVRARLEAPTATEEIRRGHASPVSAALRHG